MILLKFKIMNIYLFWIFFLALWAIVPLMIIKGRVDEAPKIQTSPKVKEKNKSWFNFECLWRSENNSLQPTSNKKIRLENKKVEYIDDLMCSSCFMFINKLEDYQKMAVMGNDHYGFCSDECYNRWLNPGFQKYLGKINKQ